MGPRRAGKSTLLRSEFPNHQYVTLDDLDELDHAKKDPKDFIGSLGKSFIIDEAQRAPELAIAIKYVIDQERVDQAILTGSTGLRLLDKSQDTLAGRLQIYHLPPCCWGENLAQNARETVAKVAQRDLRNALEYGGFPEILNLESLSEKEEVLNLYKNTYFTRDLANISNLENIDGLRALFQALIRGLGSRYEVSSLVKDCGLSTPTTKKYLNSLLQSELAFKVHGYHLGPAKRYISAAKTYFADNGILTALSNDFSAGQQFENFVVSEIEKRRKLNFFKCDQLFYYESTGGREIDLILEEKNDIYCIEIKSGTQVKNRDLQNLKEYSLAKSHKTTHKILIYQGAESYKDNGIQIVPVFDFYKSQRPF